MRKTVFIYHLPPTVTEEKMHNLFSEKIGTVTSVILIRDRFTGRPRGFGYVEFEQEAHAKKAINLAGTMFEGMEMLVKSAQAEKNIIHSAQTGGGAITRLYFKPVPDELDEQDMKSLFETVGAVESLEFRKNIHGQRLGYGYVKYVPNGFVFLYIFRYKKPDDANKALIKIHNVKLAGIYTLKLGMWNEERVNPTDMDTPLLSSSQPMQSSTTTTSNNNMSQASFNKSSAPQNGAVGAFRSLEDDDNIKHSRNNAPAEKEVPATQNIVLTNMFDPKGYVLFCFTLTF